MADDPDPTGYQAIIAWLQSLDDDTVVRWTDDKMDAEHPWSFSWVDVRVPGSPPEVEHGLNWFWTVERVPEDDTPVDLTTLWLPASVECHSVWDPDDMDYLGQTVVEVGSEITPEDRLRLAHLLAEKDSRRYMIDSGWRPKDISEALHWWTRLETGRYITFEWDPDGELSKMAQAALAVMERQLAGEGEFYEIGTAGGLKIKAAPEVLDFLLAEGPEIAAEVMGQFNDLITEGRRGATEDGS